MYLLESIQKLYDNKFIIIYRGGEIIVRNKYKKIIGSIIVVLLFISFFFTFDFSSASSTVLKKDMRDGSVVILKKDLDRLGFSVPGNGTTLFGKETEKKVKEFQKYYGLE